MSDNQIDSGYKRRGHLRPVIMVCYIESNVYLPEMAGCNFYK